MKLLSISRTIPRQNDDSTDLWFRNKEVTAESFPPPFETNFKDIEFLFISYRLDQFFDFK